MISQPKAGTTWEHYKGGLYTFLGVAIREHDGVEMAVYEDLDHKSYVRPLSEFLAKFQQEPE